MVINYWKENCYVMLYLGCKISGDFCTQFHIWQNLCQPSLSRMLPTLNYDIGNWLPFVAQMDTKHGKVRQGDHGSDIIVPQTL